MEEFSNILEDEKTDNMTVKKTEDTWVILCNKCKGSREKPRIQLLYKMGT